MRRDLAVALSLANLCFVPVWAQLLPGAYGHYFMKAPPSAAMNMGVLLSMLLLALLFWGGITIARRATKVHIPAVARWVFLVVVVAALNGAVILAGPGLAPQSWLSRVRELLIVRLVVAMVAVYVLIRWHRRVVRAAAILVLVLLPFVLLTVAQVTWLLIKTKYELPVGGFADKAPAPRLEMRRTSSPRVLWFLFDGMDQRLSFVERPSTLKLPEIDRFRDEAVYARNAYTPAGNTLWAMPALITGRPVQYARPSRSDELMITFADSAQAVGWSTQENVFSKARAVGANTALVGYYHPYCRVIGQSLTSCWWETDWWRPVGMDDPDVSVPDAMVGVVPAMLDGMRAALPLVWRAGVLQRAVDSLQRTGSVEKQRREHIKHYRSILERTKQVATDSTLGLVLVHWPIPHLPGIYSRSTGELTSSGESGYLDNLALVDRTLGEMRRAMERAGVWDETVVLVTSDHHFGGKTVQDHRIPFLLKLAGNPKAVTYDPPFNTIVIHDLFLALLRGELTDPESVVNWLDQRRLYGPSTAATDGNAK